MTPTLEVSDDYHFLYSNFIKSIPKFRSLRRTIQQPSHQPTYSAFRSNNNFPNEQFNHVERGQMTTTDEHPGRLMFIPISLDFTTRPKANTLKNDPSSTFPLVTGIANRFPNRDSFLT